MAARWLDVGLGPESACGGAHQFSVDDPTAVTKAWTGEFTMSRTTGRIYECSCHEGNYALPNLLKILEAPGELLLSRARKQAVFV
jgi:hypothetical protein